MRLANRAFLNLDGKSGRFQLAPQLGVLTPQGTGFIVPGGLGLGGTGRWAALDGRQHAVPPLLAPFRHRGRIDAFAPQNGTDLAGMLAAIQLAQQRRLVGGRETAATGPCRHVE